MAEDGGRGELAGRPARAGPRTAGGGRSRGSPAAWLTTRSVQAVERRRRRSPRTAPRTAAAGRRTSPTRSGTISAAKTAPMSVRDPAVPADLRADEPDERRRAAPTIGRKSVSSVRAEDPAGVVDRPARRSRAMHRDEGEASASPPPGRAAARQAARGRFIRRGPRRAAWPGVTVWTFSSYSARAWRSARVRWARCSSAAGSTGASVLAARARARRGRPGRTRRRRAVTTTVAMPRPRSAAMRPDPGRVGRRR